MAPIQGLASSISVVFSSTLALQKQMMMMKKKRTFLRRWKMLMKISTKKMPLRKSLRMDKMLNERETG